MVIERTFRLTTKEIEIQYALGSLSHDELLKLADNKRTSRKVLTMLSNSQNWAIKSRVAGNPNTPIEILIKLSKDKDWIIRSNAFYNGAKRNKRI